MGIELDLIEASSESHEEFFVDIMSYDPSLTPWKRGSQGERETRTKTRTDQKRESIRQQREVERWETQNTRRND